jgi:glycerol-3-phosphate dehydrogenase (NAD(P)+)
MDMKDSYKASCLACLVRDLGDTIVALGGKRETIFTFAGLVDMLLTCMSSKSRNFTFGTYIGRGYSMKDAFETMSVKTVEGIYTLSTIKDLMKKRNFNIKSLEVLYGILYNNDSKEDLLDKIRM